MRAPRCLSVAPRGYISPLRGVPRALPPLTDGLSVKPRLSRTTALVGAVWVSIPPLLHLGIVGAILFRGFGSAVPLSPRPVRIVYLLHSPCSF